MHYLSNLMSNPSTTARCMAFVLASLPLSTFASSADYELIDTHLVDDGGDAPSVSAPRDLAYDSDRSLLLISSSRNVGATLDLRLLAFDPTSELLVGGVTYNSGAAPLGCSYSLAVTPDGNSAYIAHSPVCGGSVVGTPSIWAMDTDPGSPTGFSVLNRIQVGGSRYGPESLASTPDGSRIYATHRGDYFVRVIDSGTNAMIANVPVPRQTIAIAMAPDGMRAYAVNRSYNAVYAIDTDPSSPTYNTRIQTISTTNGASNSGSAIAISPDGRFAYTTQAHTGVISVIDIDPVSLNYHTEVSTISTSANRLFKVTVTPDSKTLFAVNTINDELVVVDLDESSPSFRTHVQSISFPEGSSPDDVVSDQRIDGLSYVSLRQLGSIAVIGKGIVDSDFDGVPDDIDACVPSDLSFTIVIGGVDTGIENDLLDDGCTLADLIFSNLDEGAGTADFVELLVYLKGMGYISGREMGEILKETRKL